MSYSSNLNDEDFFNSQSSDEKMDTGSESFPTQDTPNSVVSSDFDDRDLGTEQNVLRLQNPETVSVLRLAGPENIDNAKTSVTRFKEEHNDSLVTKMSNLTINSPTLDTERPKNLGISPPRLSSTLISTTNHPLMGLGSPDENYPDLIPKKVTKVEEEKDLSLSSIEDERTNETNNYDLYSPLCNTSKNNLYFTENFVTADSQILSESHRETSVPPDVARIDKKIVRRKIIPRISESPPTKHLLTTPQRVLGRILDGKRDENAISKYVEERNKKIGMHSTPKCNITDSTDASNEEYHTGVSEWCESPPILRSVPNFQLPIEMSTNVSLPAELESPDVISSSTQSEGSLHAHLSIHAGRACLKHTNKRLEHNNSDAERRRIVVPPLEDDTCSLESISGASMGSEEEAPAPLPPRPADSDEEDTKRSKSSVSSYSSGIPEYSAAEEYREERRWLTVTRGTNQVTCDMTVIEPYKRFVSHGGYDKSGVALIVFSACHLPDNSRTDYTYVMDNLFLYVIWSLERLITDEYILVYLHGSASRRRLPSFHWLHECYKLIDRRLRKSLKHLYLVHPTFWLKSLVVLTKPFVSSKFFRKLSYVKSLEELMDLVPVEPNAIPELVKDYEAGRR